MRDEGFFAKKLRNAPAKSAATAIKSAKYVPNMGTFDSQLGNISFPTWEYFVPLMGICKFMRV